MIKCSLIIANMPVIASYCFGVFSHSFHLAIGANCESCGELCYLEKFGKYYAVNYVPGTCIVVLVMHLIVAG